MVVRDSNYPYVLKFADGSMLINARNLRVLNPAEHLSLICTLDVHDSTTVDK